MKFLFNFIDDKDDPDSIQVVNALENIDDDCDRHGIVFVKNDDREFADDNGINDIPALIYYEDGIPNLYDGINHSI